MAKLWQMAVESVTKKQEEAYDALFDEAAEEHLKGDCADCEDGLSLSCEVEIASGIEDRQEEQFDDQAEAEYHRLEETFRTLDQDLKPIEEGGKYLDDVRYPEVRLFHFLWPRFDYESAAEIAEAFKTHMEQWNAHCAKDQSGLYRPGLVMPQDMVEKCLHKLSLWSLLETKVENGVTKYRMDHATVKANRGAPYVYKLIEELL
jgi:hypothetical protein